MSFETVDAIGDSTEINDELDARGEPRQGLHRSAPPLVSEADVDSDRYNMKHSERGMALIINNKTFERKEKREGTDVDARKMEQLFRTLGFEQVRTLRDKTVAEMSVALSEAAKEDHTERDCFACVILSHGGEGYVYGKDDKISIDKLVEPFKGHNCPSLAGKPKLFFFQTCRQDKFDMDTTVTDHDGGEEMEDEVSDRRIPTEADFLMAYSVIPGFLSYRHTLKGSWFIQSIYDVFMENWQKLDLLTMMTRVNKKVAYEFGLDASKELKEWIKQMPCITSMLTKDVFFFSEKETTQV